MNIVRENLEDGTTLLKATVAEADYNEAVDKALRTYKRKANVPGFRPGMVPMSIINKMYRKGVVAEEAYRAASNGCFDYIEKEKLTLVGDMIPSEKQQPLDFENSTEYEFAFEVGLAPEINIPLSKKDKVKKYTIAIEDKMREGYRSNFTRRFGKLVDVDTVEKEDALNVTLDQPEMKIEEAYVGLIGMSDAARKPFLGKKVGDTMEVNVNELYPTPAQRAAILQVKEDELEGINPKFTLTITKIRRFTEPELNDEFFKMAFPEGNVKNADEFAQYIDSQISRDLSRESDFLFTLDIRRMLLDKANLALPDAFLKRWLFTINEGKFSLEDRKGFRQVPRNDEMEPDPEALCKRTEARGNARRGDPGGQSACHAAVRLLRHEPGGRRHAGQLRQKHPRKQGGEPQGIRKALRTQSNRRGRTADYRHRHDRDARRVRQTGRESPVRVSRRCPVGNRINAATAAGLTLATERGPQETLLRPFSILPNGVRAVLLTFRTVADSARAKTQKTEPCETVGLYPECSCGACC